MKTHCIVDENDNVIDEFKKLTLAKAENMLSRCFINGGDYFIQDEVVELKRGDYADD